MDIQTLIADYTIDHFLLTRCQKKRYEYGYDILKDFFIKIIGFKGLADRQKLGYFSLMKHFGLILLA